MKNPVLFALLTALCWGLYGPVLGQARSALASPFKPYLAIGVATAAFLFHLPAAWRRRDPRAERLRIAAEIPPLAALVRRGDEDAADKAVSLGIVLLWPLYLVPLVRWMTSL